MQPCQSADLLLGYLGQLQKHYQQGLSCSLESLQPCKALFSLIHCCPVQQDNPELASLLWAVYCRALQIQVLCQQSLPILHHHSLNRYADQQNVSCRLGPRHFGGTLLHSVLQRTGDGERPLYDDIYNLCKYAPFLSNPKPSILKPKICNNENSFP